MYNFIVDYYLLGRERYTPSQLIQAEHNLPAFNWLALGSYGVGALLAYYWNWVAPLSFGASLPVFVITGALYFVVSKSVVGKRVVV